MAPNNASTIAFRLSTKMPPKVPSRAFSYVVIVVIVSYRAIGIGTCRHDHVAIEDNLTITPAESPGS